VVLPRDHLATFRPNPDLVDDGFVVQMCPVDPTDRVVHLVGYHKSEKMGTIKKNAVVGYVAIDPKVDIYFPAIMILPAGSPMPPPQYGPHEASNVENAVADIQRQLRD